MGLAGAGGAGPGDDRPVRLDFDAAELIGVRRAAGTLDVAGDPDSERSLPGTAVGPAAALSRAYLVVPDGRHGPVQGRLVVAGVVGATGQRPVRELTDEVAATQLDRIDPEAAGELIHAALDRVGRLGAARAAVGGGRRGGGEHGADPGVDPRGAVRPGRHGAGLARDRVTGVRVGADVGVRPQLIAQQPTVLGGRQPGFLLLAPAARRGGQGFRAVLDPPHRPAQQPGQVAGEHVLRIGPALRAEGPAGHRHDHPYLAGLQPEHPGQAVPEPMLRLMGHPDGEPAVLFRARQHGPALQGGGDQELLPVAGPHHHRRGGEHVVGGRAILPVRHDVGATGEQRWRVRQGRLPGVEQRRQRLQPDDDPLGPVLGERP